MNRLVSFVLVWLSLPFSADASEPHELVALEFEAGTPVNGSPEWDWWQARTAFVPGTPPILLTTMSETGRTGIHNFHDIDQSISRDGGKTWSQPSPIPSLKRTAQLDGYEVAPGDSPRD